jgi:hypothetical protein
MSNLELCNPHYRLKGLKLYRFMKEDISYTEIKKKKKIFGKSISVLIKEKEKIETQIESINRTIAHFKGKIPPKKQVVKVWDSEFKIWKKKSDWQNIQL